MIYHSNERQHKMIGVDERCDREDMVSVEQLCGCGRLLGVITVPPGGAIADHTHHKEFEVYYLLSGSGLYNNNGVEVTIGPGDVTYCPEGETHGVLNNRKEDLVFVAFIGFPAK